MDSKDVTNYVYFIYSEEYNKEQKQINLKMGRDFRCGQVSVGSTKKQYSIKVGYYQYEAMKTRYPDLKIVYKSKPGEAKFSEPYYPIHS